MLSYKLFCFEILLDKFLKICYNNKQILNKLNYAGMAELADAIDLGSISVRSAGSSPVTRIKTVLIQNLYQHCFIEFIIYSVSSKFITTN